MTSPYHSFIGKGASVMEMLIQQLSVFLSLLGNRKYGCRLFSFICRDAFWPQIFEYGCGSFHFHNRLAMSVFTEAVQIKQGCAFIEKFHPTCLGLFLEDRLLVLIIISLMLNSAIMPQI